MARTDKSGGGPAVCKTETPRDAHVGEGNSILSGLPPLLTIDEAAAILRLSPGRCRAACREGRVPAFQIGGRWRVSRLVLERMLLGGDIS
jgi:excisionase family DNA binding protein